MASSDDIITIKEMGDKRPWWQYLDATKWKLFIAALIGVTLDGYDFVLITLALPEIKATFDLTLVQSAALVSAAFITRWLGGLILGGVGDRFGRKPAMIIATVLFAIGSLLMGFSPNFMFLFVMRMVVGFAMAGEYGSSATYVIESWHPRIRGKWHCTCDVASPKLATGKRRSHATGENRLNRVTRSRCCSAEGACP